MTTTNYEQPHDSQTASSVQHGSPRSDSFVEPISEKGEKHQSSLKEKHAVENEVNHSAMRENPIAGGKAVTTAEMYEVPEEGQKFHKLSWIRLTSVLIVEAIALGSLSMPGAFATLGMVPATIMTVAIGLIAIYSSLHIGETWLKFPFLVDYPLAGGLIFERMFGVKFKALGYWFTTVCFILLLGLTTGSHALTGRIAFNALSDDALCSALFAFIAAIILFIIALPKTFNQMAFLGYLDFASICAAILITIIAAGVQGSDKPGGLAAVEWYAFLPKDQQPTVAEAGLAVTQIVFSYAFAQTQFSMMTELKKPTDFKKAIWALGITEIFIYTLTGSILYRFVGQDVSSPALLSTATTTVKIAFGVALPVIFISGSINTTVAARFLYAKIFPRGSPHHYISTPKGNVVWVSLVGIITILAYIVAELIPVFGALLGLISALFISFFSFIFPPLFWIFLLREGDWKKGKNLFLTIANALIVLMGFVILVLGIYSSALDIKDEYDSGSIGSPFSCIV